MDKIRIEKDRIEKVTEKGGQTLGSAMKNVLQFATDSIGLVILKKAGNKELAYKVIKTGRDIADTAGKLTETTIKTGGVVAGGVVKTLQSDRVKDTVDHVKNTISSKMEDADAEFQKSEDLKNIKTKISRMIKEKLDEAKDMGEELKDKAADKTEEILEDLKVKEKELEEKIHKEVKDTAEDVRKEAEKGHA